MGTARSVLIPLCLSLACQNYAAPPIEPELRLEYPRGFVADLPNLNPGDTVRIAVQVVRGAGTPVAGVEIIWDDQRFPVSARPDRGVTDSGGRVTARWTMLPLPGGASSRTQSIRAYRPGARNSPLEYRVQVVRCTRCPPPSG